MSSDGLAELFDQGLAAHHAGGHALAAQLYRQVLEASPDHADAIHQLGLLAYQHADLKTALPLIERSLILMPEKASFHLNYATVLCDAHQPAKSLAECDHAIELGVDESTAQYAKGNAFAALRRFPEAEAAFRQVIALKQDFAIAWNNLGNALLHQEQVDQAIKAYEKAIALDAAYASTMTNLGNALLARRRVAEAIAMFDRAIAIEADPETRIARSMALLIQGDFEHGWAEYEVRRQTSRFGLDADPGAETMWRGEELAGKTILVYCEQGAGDCIFFARYVPLLAERGAHVILLAPPALVRLFQSLPGVSRVLPAGTPLPSFDFHCSIASLPSVMGTRVESIPATVPYLSATDESLGTWCTLLMEHLGRINVALAWSGSPSSAYPDRSIPPAMLAPLQKFANIKFYALRPPSTDLPITAIDLSPHLNDWTDTAAALQHMDLLISIDTGVAHLAGALGKPVWLMLHHAPEFRWPYHSARTPWYPTARLFHQASPGDWQSVITQISARLAKFDPRRPHLTA